MADESSSREDRVFLAKLAEQAERYEGIDYFPYRYLNPNFRLYFSLWRPKAKKVETSVLNKSGEGKTKGD